MTSDYPETSSTEQDSALKILLNREGLRLTNQRQQILDLFDDIPEGHHLSAEEIHHQLSHQGAKISHSTIYRALHLMVDLGILREVELAEGRKYYELSTPLATQHHHLVCVYCSEVVEFEDDRVTNVSQQETLGHGFLLRDSQFTVYGICPACQRSKL